MKKKNKKKRTKMKIRKKEYGHEKNGISRMRNILWDVMAHW